MKPKTRLVKETKPEETLPEVTTPDIPRDNIEDIHVDESMDATGDIEIIDHEDLPDDEDSGMAGDTADFDREVDDSMDGDENAHGDTSMVAMMDVHQTLALISMKPADSAPALCE